jgi:uncharacterized membrane protein
MARSKTVAGLNRHNRAIFLKMAAAAQIGLGAPTLRKTDIALAVVVVLAACQRQEHLRLAARVVRVARLVRLGQFRAVAAAAGAQPVARVHAVRFAFGPIGKGLPCVRY